MTVANPSSIPRIRILVVRHGETQQNVERIIQGQLDTDLNSRGRDQARRTAEALKDETIDEIYASPLRRAKDTAQAILSLQSTTPSPPQFFLEPRLKERGFGSLEGKVYSGTKRDSIEGIESMVELTERLASFWNDLVSGSGPWEEHHSTTQNGNGNGTGGVARSEREIGKERTVLIVGHGAALSAMLNEVLLNGGYLVLAPGVSPGRFWNCSITEVFSPTSPTPISTSSKSPGHISKKSRWTVRPSHLNPRSLKIKMKSNAERGSDSSGNESEWSDLDDIGYGPGLSVCERWADVRHLPEILGGEGASSAAVKNVDEMVGKETKEE